MGQAARRQTVRESARESVRAQHTIERASSSSVALSLLLLLLPLLCLVLYMCAVRLCVCVWVRAACEIDFSIYKKKIKIYLYFRLLRGVFFSAPPPLASSPHHTLNIIFVAAAKNIIYVLFMIFYDFPLFSHWHFLFAWNLFDLYAAPLGHTLLSDLKETRTRTQTRTWTQTHTGRPLYIVSLLDSISDSESGSDLASHLRHNLALACCIYRLLILFWGFIYTRDSDKD